MAGYRNIILRLFTIQVQGIVVLMPCDGDQVVSVNGVAQNITWEVMLVLLLNHPW